MPTILRRLFKAAQIAFFPNLTCIPKITFLRIAGYAITVLAAATGISAAATAAAATATAAAAAAGARTPAGAIGTTSVEVDAREAPRGIEHVHMVMPVKPGKLTLLYPKWLPGEHAPNGPIGGLAALRFTGNGQAIAWQRDADNMFAFHLTIPTGVTSLDIVFEVDAVKDASNNNALRLSTESLAIIVWNELVLYPAGIQSDDMHVAAKLTVPSGWQIGTALPQTTTAGATTQFAPVSLTTLIDSPVITGRYFRTVDLHGSPAAYLHMVADSEAALAITPETTAQLRKLVQEAPALFGATHYNEYHFLLTLSDRIGYEGIEHHQSSDNRVAERALIDEDLRHSSGVETLLPHEYVHSWNGKYRRPAGLATGNYDSPMHGELLWVYEGLTEYLGMVLSARSGLATTADSRDNWANVAAWLQTRSGRDWRPLADTAIAAQISYTQASQWRARTRATDFYDESAMLWLEADTLIRTKSQGAKSLDDFCRLFYGPPSTAPRVVSYTFDDVVKALNTVWPYDWREFWTTRLNRVTASAPLEGLTASGWRLTFAAEPSVEQKGAAALNKQTDFNYSLGFALADDGALVTDVLPGTPADSAGLAPDSTLIAVNGRKYSKDVLEDALKAYGTEPRTLKLLVQKDDMFDTLDVHYAGGPRYPRLERDTRNADLLTAITTARTAAAP
jgi:predicted metalloprotease with PDZ domain